MTRKEKHFIKLFLMMLLAVLLCCLPVTASAKTVAKIGNKKYSSLEQAVKKVKKVRPSNSSPMWLCPVLSPSI